VTDAYCGSPLHTTISLRYPAQYDENVLEGVRKLSCAIDIYNKDITIHNLRFNCNNNELRNIFSNLTPGLFPTNGFWKGHIIGVTQNIWNGKNISYVSGTLPNDYGIVTNTWFGSLKIFKGTVYRATTPIDGKESFVLDYKNDTYVYYAVDYIRTVQSNLYLGIATFRSDLTMPKAYFLLLK